MPGFWSELSRDVVLVTGADASSYLQSQISQDIRNLADGETTYSFVLQPMGKVDALVRIHRRAVDHFVIDTDPGFGSIVAARLQRFKIRVAVEIEMTSWNGIAVRGAAAAPAGAVPAWGRDDAFDVLDASGGELEPPVGVEHGTADDLERARIEAGWPAMGHEITDATIPAETGHVVDLAVSFTKGCYPGQELVERMDSRGSAAPRFVRRLRGSGIGPSATDEVRSGDKTVGAITSAAAVASGWVALASIGRSVAVGDTVTLGNAESVVVEDARSR